MRIGGVAAWLITELAVFSVAVYALRNPDKTGALISATGTSIGGITKAFEGRVGPGA